MLDLWWATPDDARDDLLDWFTPEERERADAYRIDVDRRRFTVGCALTRLVTATLLGVAPVDVPVTRDCPDCDRPHGRPVVPGSGLSVSVSHSGSAVVVAVGDAGSVGVDVERVVTGRTLPTSLTLAESERRIQSAAEDPEAAFFRYWVRKEAVIKATGRGLRTPPASVIVSGPDEPAALIGAPDLDAGRATLLDVEAPAGHAAAVAVLDAGIAVATRRRDGSAALGAERRESLDKHP